ncbi:NUDIX hydrolase [Chitinophaga filiformis]|uniref:NUDIX hydrolase n=1 Tax=Chitinophaga filiformis TaxID=104663 RepID=UPI001F456C79|nr:NUDIX domain-containing protein [Chitinophaga filiformis]MCF6403080.1 NUDIX hydrolase [Chitinophaga filiformis]
MDTRELDPSYFDEQVYVKHVAVDNVIFGYHDRELKVLLQRPNFQLKWTVAGGYVRKTESIEEAAHHIAFLRTGLKNLFLEQFKSFGHPSRTKDDWQAIKKAIENAGMTPPPDSWILDYSVSIAFYTLTEFSLVTVQKGPFDEALDWWPVSQLPPMMFDHALIIEEALKALRRDIYHYPIGYELLPRKFTLPEIHSLYETILGKMLDNRNFTRKLMSTGIIKKLDEVRNIGAHRSPYLYKFEKKNYDAALKNGIFLGF